MTDAVVANLFLTVRVLILGGLLLALPHIARRGLLFGVYVGEDFAGTDAGRRLLRRWTVGCLLVVALALAVGYGISLAGHPVAGNLTGTGVFLLAALRLYLGTYARTRRAVPPRVARQGRTATASLSAPGPDRSGLAKLVLGVCVISGIATVAYAAAAYARMPAQVPTLTGPFGPTVMSEKSVVAIMFTPVANLVFSSLYAGLAVLMATAKRSVRGGSGGHSAEAQDAFRALNASLFSGGALLICALLTLLSIQLVRVALAATNSVGMGVWWIAGLLLLFLVAGLARIVIGSGQGGALREQASTDTPLSGSLADDTHWVLGMFYVNRDDPSIMIEKRFGVGYGLNYGNRIALLFVAGFGVLVVSLIAIGLVAILS